MLGLLNFLIALISTQKIIEKKCWEWLIKILGDLTFLGIAISNYYQLRDLTNLFCIITACIFIKMHVRAYKTWKRDE